GPGRRAAARRSGPLHVPSGLQWSAHGGAQEVVGAAVRRAPRGTPEQPRYSALLSAGPLGHVDALLDGCLMPPCWMRYVLARTRTGLLARTTCVARLS